MIRGLPKRWNTIAAKCLADNVQGRYSSADELLGDLGRIGRWSRTRAAALFLMMLVGVASLFAWRTYHSPIMLTRGAWERWCDSITWIRPLEQMIAREPAQWQEDRQTLAVAADIRICCLPFDKSPDLERSYRQNEGSDPERIRRALLRCGMAVAEDREAALSVSSAGRVLPHIEDFFLNSSATDYWPRLRRVRQDREALFSAGCSACASSSIS